MSCKTYCATQNNKGYNSFMKNLNPNFNNAMDIVQDLFVYIDESVVEVICPTVVMAISLHRLD